MSPRFSALSASPARIHAKCAIHFELSSAEQIVTLHIVTLHIASRNLRLAHCQQRAKTRWTSGKLRNSTWLANYTCTHLAHSGCPQVWMTSKLARVGVARSGEWTDGHLFVCYQREKILLFKQSKPTALSLVVAIVAIVIYNYNSRSNQLDCRPHRRYSSEYDSLALTLKRAAVGSVGECTDSKLWCTLLVTVVTQTA